MQKKETKDLNEPNSNSIIKKWRISNIINNTIKPEIDKSKLVLKNNLEFIKDMNEKLKDI